MTTEKLNDFSDKAAHRDNMAKKLREEFGNMERELSWAYWQSRADIVLSEA